MLIKLKGVSVNSTPRADGRYQGYATLNGEKRYFYGKTKKEVEDKIIFCLKEDERSKKKTAKKEKNSPTFGEYAENWIKLYKEPNLKPTSLNSMRITLYRTMLATGMRIGEALALTASDIDTKENVIHVTKNVVFIDGKRIEQDTPKSEAGNRDLPISHALATELRTAERDLIFPFSYNSVSLAIRRIAHRTGIKVSSHILRHTYATRLEEAGIPPKIKQYLLGHATLDMTENVYTDVQKSYVKRLSDTIRGIFSPVKP